MSTKSKKKARRAGGAKRKDPVAGSDPSPSLNPARPGRLLVLRYNSAISAHCAATSAQNAVQNPALASGWTLGKFHGQRSDGTEVDRDEEGHVDISNIAILLVNTGYIGGSPGKEFPEQDIVQGTRIISIGTPVYHLFNGDAEGVDKFVQLIHKERVGENLNEFGILAVNIVDENDEVEVHFIAFWRRGQWWYITGGETNGMIFRVHHGDDGRGLANLLFCPDRREYFGTRLAALFEGSTIQFDTVAGYVFLPIIQLRSPEMWDNKTVDAIAREMPWPITGMCPADGGKVHSLQIIEDGDANCIEELAN